MSALKVGMAACTLAAACLLVAKGRDQGRIGLGRAGIPLRRRHSLVLLGRCRRDASEPQV